MKAEPGATTGFLPGATKMTSSDGAVWNVVENAVWRLRRFQVDGNGTRFTRFG